MSPFGAYEASTGATRSLPSSVCRAAQEPAESADGAPPFGGGRAGMSELPMLGQKREAHRNRLAGLECYDPSPEQWIGHE